MKSNIFKQAIYDMRRQPVIGIVTMIGTAFAIFLIMIVVMMDRSNTASFAPETNRNRTLYGRFINVANDVDNSNSSASMSEKRARELYDNLDGSECTTFLSSEEYDISSHERNVGTCPVKLTDDKFWQVFDFRFLSGRPYDHNAFETSAKEAVISKNTARRLFGTEDATGQTIMINLHPFMVVGVTEDVSPLAREAYAEVYIPYRAVGLQDETWGDEYEKSFGPFSAIILAESTATFPRIRADVQKRKQQFEAELKAMDENNRLVDHGSPYTQDVVYTVRGSNTDPDTSGDKINLAIYAILLILPAINLSSMTQSRLVRRIGEIGVKRAYGATRPRIITEIITENFLVTLAGGVLGLTLCLVFGYFFSDMIFTEINYTGSAPLPSGLLFDWKIYGSALLFCFILNLLSSGIPAWRASRIDPVNALSGKI